MAENKGRRIGSNIRNQVAAYNHAWSTHDKVRDALMQCARELLSCRRAGKHGDNTSERKGRICTHLPTTCPPGCPKPRTNFVDETATRQHFVKLMRYSVMVKWVVLDSPTCIKSLSKTIQKMVSWTTLFKIFLSFNFLICKMNIIIVLSWQEVPGIQ